MKTILTILVLSVLALLNDLALACFGLAVVAAVVLIGDKLGREPSQACGQNCNQGRACSCRPRPGVKP